MKNSGVCVLFVSILEFDKQVLSSHHLILRENEKRTKGGGETDKGLEKQKKVLKKKEEKVQER